MNATKQIIDHAIPSPRIVPAPAADEGIPRSMCRVLPSQYGSDTMEGEAMLVNVCDDGDCEIIHHSGWRGWVHHTRITR